MSARIDDMIVILEKCENPKIKCNTGDLFIKERYGTFWISLWNGTEAWPINGPYISLEDALADASREIA